MKKYDLFNCYVGVLNFSFAMDDLLETVQDDLEKKKLIAYTCQNGAIDLKNYQGGEDIIWQKKRLVKKIFTVFYQMDDGNYLCLHNNQKYGMKMSDYPSNLERIINVLPHLNMSYNYNIKLSDVRKIFDNLFKKDNFIVNKDATAKLDIKNFYIGDISLCRGYKFPDNKELLNQYFLKNLPEYFILQANPWLYKGIDFSYTGQLGKDSIEYNYSSYNSIYYKIPNGAFYNINNYHFYSLHNKRDCESLISIDKPLIDELDNLNIHYSKKESIPKVLKLQKSIIRK